MPTTTAATKPAANSEAELRNNAMRWPVSISRHSRSSVADSGTMKAGLLWRPTISHNARPPHRLRAKGAWRLRYPRMRNPRPLLAHHRVGVAPDRRVHDLVVGRRSLAVLDVPGLGLERDQFLDLVLGKAVVVDRPQA